jgi:hypothetical protein
VQFISNLATSIRPASVAFQAPNILRFFVPQHVSVSAFDTHPEIRFARRIPAVFDLDNLQRLFTHLQPHRPFIGLVPGIAFHCHPLHGSPLYRSDFRSAFHAAPKNTTTAEICIHTSNPITAPNPPYTTFEGIRRT